MTIAELIQEAAVARTEGRRTIERPSYDALEETYAAIVRTPLGGALKPMESDGLVPRFQMFGVWWTQTLDEYDDHVQCLRAAGFV